MTAPKEIKRLIERFHENREAYLSSEYNETQLRREFLGPFFKALGWDADNEQGYAQEYKDVIHEDTIKIGGAAKAPAYAFRIGGTRKFFVEMKPTSHDAELGQEQVLQHAEQLRDFHGVGLPFVFYTNGHKHFFWESDFYSPEKIVGFPTRDDLECVKLRRRIAAILDKADAVRRTRQQTLDLADQFLRSAFLDMFGDPVTNPKRWPVYKLRDVLIDIKGGWSASGEARAPEPGEKAVLKISAVTSGRYRPEECKAVSNPRGKQVIVPKVGDVLFSRANTRELVAATCLVDREDPSVFLPDKLWRLVPSNKLIRGEYIRFALSTDSLRSLIRRRATGTSGSMLNVSKAKLRSIPIPVPKLQLQERFGQAWSSHQSLLHRAQEATETCEVLLRSLTQRAFRGELA